MQMDFNTFSVAKPLITELISKLTQVATDVKTDRAMRALSFDIEALRAARKIDKDSTILPLRIINRNIKRALPPFIEYLMQPVDPVTFFEGTTQVPRVTTEFTSLAKYPGWSNAFIRGMDSAKGLGRGAIEVTFDISKPGHVAFYYISKEDLLIPENCKDVQTAPMCGIRFPITLLTFQEMAAKNSFDATQVAGILDKYSNSSTYVNEKLEIYKFFFRQEGVTYVAWYSEKCGDWLKAPAPLNLGLTEDGEVIDPVTNIVMPGEVSVKIPFYPLYILTLAITENEIIQSHEGVCKEDRGVQDGVVALWSSMVNGSVRSANIYASPRMKNVEDGVTPKVTDVQLENGRMYTHPVDFHSTPVPDEAITRAASALDVWNSEAGGQVSYAANNRVDSRKTAAEVNVATDLHTKLTALEVLNLSQWIEAIFTCAWVIIQNRALRGKIKFLQIEQQVPVNVPLAPAPVSVTTMVNDIETIKKTYIIKASGEAEVVAKQRELDTRTQLLPIVQQAQSPALVNAFIMSILEIALPKDAAKFQALIQQESQYKQMAQGLLGAVKELMSGQTTPEEIQQITGQITQLEKALA